MSTDLNTGKVHEFGLSDRLRAAREHSGMTQTEFAVATGISRQTVSHYELGETAPRHPQLVMWASVSGYDLNWLVTGETPGRPPSPDGGLDEYTARDSNPEPAGLGFPLVRLGSLTHGGTFAGQRAA